MKFSQLITYLELISSSNSRLFIAEEISKIFVSSDLQEIKNLTYFLCGKLGPDYDSKVTSIGDKQLFSILKNIYKEPIPDFLTQYYAEFGDLSKALFFALEQDHTSLSEVKRIEFLDVDLIDVFTFIETLCSIKGKDSLDAKESFIKDFLEKQSPLSVKYIIKAILGQMRLGFLEMTVVDGLARAFGVFSDKKIIEDAYNRCTDLGLIAEILKKDGILGIKDLKILPGIPVRGAAAHAMELPEEIVEKLGPIFVAQPKLDGLRLQVHFLRNIGKSDEQYSVNLFSRNLLNVSPMFPDVMDSFIKFFKEHKVVSSIIVEGEVICIDSQTGHFLPFQETAKRKRKYAVDEFSKTHPVKFFIFDILFYNGQSCIEMPHKERRKVLNDIFSDNATSSTLELIEELSFEGASVSLDLENYFNDLIDKGLEGLVAKKLDATYKAGKRDFSWIKLKRIDSSQLYDSIDTVVMGYYEGLGRRASFGIGGFLVGVYSGELGKYLSIAKVGSGLSDSQWVEAKERLDKIKLEKKPEFYVVARELEPSVWVSPSMVFSVRADQVTKSKVHSLAIDKLGFGLALRFPRIVAIRKDKSEQQTTPVETLIEMFSKKSTKVMLKP